MSLSLKTFGALGLALLGIVIYLSASALGFHVIFYYGLVATFVMLGIVVLLCGGKDIG